MTILESRFLHICKGDEQALDFITLWAQCCHDIDDIVDGDRSDAEHVIATVTRMALVVTHPFFTRTPAHSLALRQVLLSVANSYADSVAWEKAPEQWKRNHADCLRHAGNEMIFAVAMICGGFEHARSISAELRELSHRTQREDEKKESAA